MGLSSCSPTDLLRRGLEQARRGDPPIHQLAGARGNQQGSGTVGGPEHGSAVPVALHALTHLQSELTQAGGILARHLGHDQLHSGHVRGCGQELLHALAPLSLPEGAELALQLLDPGDGSPSPLRGLLRIPGAEGLGDLQQGHLEQANVEAVKEISDLIAAQRAYEMNAKVVSAADQMMQSTANMFR